MHPADAGSAAMTLHNPPLARALSAADVDLKNAIAKTHALPFPATRKGLGCASARVVLDAAVPKALPVFLPHAWMRGNRESTGSWRASPTAPPKRSYVANTSYGHSAWPFLVCSVADDARSHWRRVTALSSLARMLA